MRNGFALVSIAIIAFTAAMWTLFEFIILAREQKAAFALGNVYMLLLQGGVWLLLATHAYLTKRGWVASPAEWWKRVRFQIVSDWIGISDARGWDVEIVRVHVMRNKIKGTLSLCFAVLGFHAHIGVLVDLEEFDKYTKVQHAAREEAIKGMPPIVQEAMRNMMRDMPIDVNPNDIKTGVIQMDGPLTPVPEWLEDEDPDDGNGNGGGNGVH